MIGSMIRKKNLKAPEADESLKSALGGERQTTAASHDQILPG
jgi:hypothetical protein